MRLLRASLAILAIAAPYCAAATRDFAKSTPSRDARRAPARPDRIDLSLPVDDVLDSPHFDATLTDLSSNLDSPASDIVLPAKAGTQTEIGRLGPGLRRGTKTSEMRRGDDASDSRKRRDSAGARENEPSARVFERYSRLVGDEKGWKAGFFDGEDETRIYFLFHPGSGAKDAPPYSVLHAHGRGVGVEGSIRLGREIRKDAPTTPVMLLERRGYTFEDPAPPSSYDSIYALNASDMGRAIRVLHHVSGERPVAVTAHSIGGMLLPDLETSRVLALGAQDPGVYGMTSDRDALSMASIASHGWFNGFQVDRSVGSVFRQVEKGNDLIQSTVDQSLRTISIMLQSVPWVGGTMAQPWELMRMAGRASGEAAHRALEQLRDSFAVTPESMIQGLAARLEAEPDSSPNDGYVESLLRGLALRAKDPGWKERLSQETVWAMFGRPRADYRPWGAKPVALILNKQDEIVPMRAWDRLAAELGRMRDRILEVAYQEGGHLEPLFNPAPSWRALKRFFDRLDPPQRL